MDDVRPVVTLVKELTVTSPFLVIETTPAALAEEVADSLADALASSGTVARAATLTGADADMAADDRDAALARVVSALRAMGADADAMVLTPAADVPFSTFDTAGWSLDVAASVGARVVLVLDAEGVPGELVARDVEVARARAAAHSAMLAAVALPGAVAAQVTVPGVLSLALPLTEEGVAALARTPEPTAVTPVAFQAGLVERAGADRRRIVLPEPEDDRVLTAAAQALARGIADIVLVGDADAIRARAGELGLDVDAARIVSVEDPELSGKYATEFARLRAKKGVTVEQARETVKDVSYFATMMIHMGDADGMVSGAAHTTAHTIRPALQIIKTKPGTAIVSSVFLMLMRDRVWAFGDCAVNTNPTPENLADIALSSAETARQFGIDPKVAMLSYSTGASGKGPDVDAVIEATRLAHEKAPELAVEGPIQFDAAVDAAVAAKKMPGSPVAGQATVFVFPSLNAGNIGYKAVQRSSGAVAVGPVLQGLNKPVNDLSRGALVEDIVNTIAITAIQAQG